MVEPIASTATGQPANDVESPDTRFDHAADAAETAVVDAASAGLRPRSPSDEDMAATGFVPVEPRSGREPRGVRLPEPEPDFLAESLASPVRTPEWPPAWLRVVHSDPEPEPEPEPAPALAPAAGDEPQSPGDFAHAFGLTMAAALSHQDEAAVDAAAIERFPVQRPLVSRKPRSRTSARAAKPVADVAALAPPAERAAPPVDVVDAPLFGSLTRAAPSTPRMVTARKVASPADAPSAETLAVRAGQRGLPASVYLLYLTSFLVAPAVVGLLIATRARRDAPEWLQSHYLFQIRTVWIAFAGVAIAVALAAVSPLQETELIGLFLPMLLVVWMVLRSARGYMHLLKLRSLSQPRTWLI